MPSDVRQAVDDLLVDLSGSLTPTVGKALNKFLERLEPSITPDSQASQPVTEVRFTQNGVLWRGKFRDFDTRLSFSEDHQWLLIEQSQSADLSIEECEDADDIRTDKIALPEMTNAAVRLLLQALGIERKEGTP